MGSIIRAIKRKKGYKAKPNKCGCGYIMTAKPGYGYVCEHCGRVKPYQGEGENNV